MSRTTDGRSSTERAGERLGAGQGQGQVRRIADVDALRGFALLGILLVNFSVMATTHHGGGLVDASFDGPLHQAWRYLSTVLLESKFYLLFSFLFGYSFTLQIRSAERAGARPVPRFLRRCAALLVIGVLHATLLYPGDILITYSVLGVILLTVRGIRPRTAVRASMSVFVFCAVAFLVLGWLVWAGHLDMGANPSRADALAAQEALRGGFGSVVGQFVSEQPGGALMTVVVQGTPAFAAFLLGLAAGKREILADPLRHRDLLRRIQRVGFPIGLAGSVVYAHLEKNGTGMEAAGFAMTVNMLTAPLLSAAYAATVLRMLSGGRHDRLGRALAPAGRMALTNYLTQSLVMALLFTGYGFALVGRVAPVLVTVIALTLFAVQLVISRWWLSTHAYGPVEWVLRAVTNARRPRWRKRARTESG
ncbi:DUF418 domain-containing protein [Streptomyces amakusaensis]|uniref:DUF418 domain-containing protein n=1 Tax=Streptomyces amakusaensis TaxID=67271 RepID=A0ABW0AKQ8_9ACTN